MSKSQLKTDRKIDRNEQKDKQTVTSVKVFEKIWGKIIEVQLKLQGNKTIEDTKRTEDTKAIKISFGWEIIK